MRSLRVGLFAVSAQFPDQDHSEVLQRTVDSAVAAERAGLDAVWLAEHHFIPYGVCPSAVALAALLLGRTRRITVGTAVSVLPATHPVVLGEQAMMLHLTSGGRFALGVGRGGPWQDLEVFGAGLEAYEVGFPEALDLLLRWLREPRVGAAGRRYRFRPVPVVPRAGEGELSAGPPVMVAATSPGTVRLAADRCLPMMLGMHCGDEEKAAMTALWRATALEAGHAREEVTATADRHVSAGVVQVSGSDHDAARALRGAMPGWLERGLAAHVTVDGRPRRLRDANAYTEMLCRLHPVGSPRLCADRLAATAERTGITRFALLAEGCGDPAETAANIASLGSEVLPLLG